MKYIKRLIAIAIIILLIGILVSKGWGLLDSGDNAPAFRTASVTRGSISDVVTATGTLNPIELANVGTQVSGQVSKLYVQANDQVKKGELLAEIDPAVLLTQVQQDNSNLESARINYEQAQRDYKRTRMLLEKEYVARVDLEHAEQALVQSKSSYEAAKITLDRDKVNLNYTKIVSPIDGIIISQDVTLGQTLAASYQTPNMFKIAGDLTKMKIDVNLAESDIGKVKANMPVTFTVDAFPDREFKGVIKVINMNPNTQQGAVSYTVNVEVDNKDKLLLPGMTAYVSIILFEQKNVLRVPVAALRFMPPPEKNSGLRRLLHIDNEEGSWASPLRASPSGMKTIYLLRNGTPTPVTVHVGATNESYAEISGDGIVENDVVITGMARSRGAAQ